MVHIHYTITSGVGCGCVCGGEAEGAALAFDWGVPFLNAGHSDAAVVRKDHDSKHRGRYS